MSGRAPSLSRTTWAAIAVHTALALWIGRDRGLVAPARPLPAASPAAAAELDLDVDDAPPSPPPAAPAPPHANGAGALASREVPRAPERAAAEGLDGSNALGPGEAASPEPRAAEPPSGPPASAPVQLLRPGYGTAGGVGSATNPFLAPPPGAERSEIADAKERADQILRQPARERELELGLGPDGPVRSALAEAASEGTADIAGRAVFRAVADGSGVVLSVTLLGCDGGHPGWTETARAALAKLRGTKLRLPSSAKHAEVTVEVTSAWKMPSGRDPGVDVDLLHLPVKRGAQGADGKHRTTITLLDPIPKITTVELSKDVKIPVPQVNVTLLGVDGDPADLGAKPRRIVHTRLVESKVL